MDQIVSIKELIWEQPWYWKSVCSDSFLMVLVGVNHFLTGTSSHWEDSLYLYQVRKGNSSSFCFCLVNKAIVFILSFLEKTRPETEAEIWCLLYTDLVFR